MEKEESNGKKRKRTALGSGVYVNKKTGRLYMQGKRKETSSEQSSASSGTILGRMDDRLGNPTVYHSDSPFPSSSGNENSQEQPPQGQEEEQQEVWAEEVRD